MEKELLDITLGASLVHRSTQKFYDKCGEQFGLGSGQFVFLLTIYEQEGITMKALASTGSFDKALVTKAIQKLEDLSFVKIVVNPNDKRERFLYTTDKTKGIMKDLYKLRRDWFSALTSGLSEEEIATFQRLDAKIVSNAQAYEQKEGVLEIEFFGMQKVTLLDYPGLVGTTLFTGGCNMRCPFCQNSDLVFLPDDLVSIKEKEVLSYLEKRKGIVEGVCISGGEPLMHDELRPFLVKLKEKGLRVKLDTNGTYPKKLKEYIEAGLVDYVAMDIKNSEKKYTKTAGLIRVDMKSIKESIQLLIEGTIDYEFRTTVVEEFHEVKDFKAIGELIKGAKKYYLQHFVDNGTCIQKGLHPLDEKSMQACLESVKPYVQHVELRG